MQNNDNTLPDLFLSESGQNLQMLERLLDEAQINASLGKREIAEAFRLVHTLKGASAMMQYDAPEQSSHQLEDILSVLRDSEAVTRSRASEVINLCFQYTDYFSEQLEIIKSGNTPVFSDKLNAALRDAASSIIPKPAGTNAMPDESSVSPAVEAPTGSTALHLTLRKCSMPHIRCGIIVHSVSSLCAVIVTDPTDIDLHPEAGKRILESGLDIFIIPKDGVDLSLITDKLAKQPFVTSVNVRDTKPTVRNAVPRETTVHISQSKLNDLVAVLDELVSVQSNVNDVIESLGVPDSRLTYLMGLIRRDAAQARDLSAEMGMVEIGTVFSQMRRLVRTMAREYGREISLICEGETILVDGSIAETISDALLHLVRNAIDHGIEPPDVRVGNGKPKDGKITLSANKENGILNLTVEDDGRGIDRRTVLQKAFEKGIISRQTEFCTNNELFDIIASAGFSTKDDVSRYSGRGVGLDTAVRRVRDMHGGILLESEAGKGSRFNIRIPTTLSLLSVLMLYMNGERVLLPTSAVEAVCFADRAETRDGNVLCKDMEYSRLHMPGCCSDSDDDVYVFLLPKYGCHYIRASRTELIGEMLLLPLPQAVPDMLAKDNIFSGCCIDKNGAVLCVLDIYKLIADK